MTSAAIYGPEGQTLSADEKAFFRDADPWGFIIFARNIDTPKQVARLTGSLRDLVGRDAPVFIDEEGGRVQRFRPPHWRDGPAAGRFGALWDVDPQAAMTAVRLNHQLMGRELKDAGVDADCAPVVDLEIPGADAVIGDRAFHGEPFAVGAMAAAALDGLADQGVAGVIKHIPGHGRAGVDSHFDLPRVDVDRDTLIASDFAAFRAVSKAFMAMTAHIVYEAYDEERCATLSKSVIDEVIRGDIGFDGLLMTDDLSMKALGGTMRARAEASITAGCDMLLHCNADMAEMVEVAHAAPRLDAKALERAEAAEAARRTPSEFDPKAAEAELSGLFLKAGVAMREEAGA